MQMRAIIVALLVASAVGVRTTAESSAKSWLHAHANPSNDELAELKGVNPDAYALVKALLVKQSMGLLNLKHPTASFTNTAPQSTEDAPVGAAAYAGLVSNSELEAHHSLRSGSQAAAPSNVALPYAEAASAGQHRDFFNWKPGGSAGMDDAAMVNQVLGAVANLKGGAAPMSLAASHSSESSGSNAMANDEAEFATAPAAPTETNAEDTAAGVKPGEAHYKSAAMSAEEAEQRAQLAAPVAQVVQEVAPLKFAPLISAPAPVVEAAAPVEQQVEEVETPVAAPKKKENSYLAGLDLNMDAAPAAPVKIHHAFPDSDATPDNGASALRDFSFGDDAPKEPKKAALVVQKTSGPKDFLANFLGMKPAAEAAAPVQRAPAAPKNSYLADLA